MRAKRAVAVVVQWWSRTMAWWSRPDRFSPDSVPGLDSAASIELIKDYYSRSLAGSETARARAQTAFTIISALATLLVGGAALAGITAQQPSVKITMIAAAAMWLVATFLYAQAATGTFSSTTTRRGLEVTGDEAGSAAKGVIALVHTERDLVRWKTKHANVAAFLAAITSVTAIGLMWILDPATQSRAVIKIDHSGIPTIKAACGKGRETLTVTLDVADLSKKYITLTEIKSADCKDASKLTIPTKWVASVAVRR